MRVRTLEVMSPAECEAAVAEAETWGAANGWTTDRHIAFPTVDVPIANLPKLHKLWKESIFARIELAQREALGLKGGAAGGAAGGGDLEDLDRSGAISDDLGVTSDDLDAISEEISDLDVFVVKYAAIPCPYPYPYP